MLFAGRKLFKRRTRSKATVRQEQVEDAACKLLKVVLQNDNAPKLPLMGCRITALGPARVQDRIIKFYVRKLH